MSGRSRAGSARWWEAASLAAVFFALAGCGGGGSEGGPGPLPTPIPTPTPGPGVAGATPGRATGPTAIALVAADPLPGSTLSGCASAAACAGRVRMSFRVTPTASGTVLFYVGFLHAANKTACLQGRGAGATLRAGEPQTVEMVFDQADSSTRCGTPLDLRDLAFNVEGTTSVASRQEWALAYLLVP